MKIKQKRIISLFLAIMMLFSVLPAGTMTASADSFTIRSTAPSSSNEYYYSNKNPFYSAGYSGQCTWYAYGRAYEILGKKPSLCLSDAKNWYYYNKNNGYYKYGQTPKAGAIVCWANGTNGHVGVVEKVVNDTDVYVSEANVDGGNWRYRHYNPKTWNSNFQGYIYLLDSASTHTHTYSGSYFESAHPHKIYQKCSCGKTKYTGATRAYQSCSTCMKLSWSYVQPVKAYTINTGKTTVYSSVNGTAKSNKIYDTDLCTISQIYDCGWCKVTFPLDSGGTDTGYCKIGVFMKGGGYIMYTSKQINTYRRSDLKTAIGYAGAGDKIYILGTAGSAVQIAYPLTAGGWKVGWVPISAITYTIKYNANGGSGTMSSSSVKYQSAITLTANKFTKTGYTFSGWNVYRSSDKTWYVSGQGWKTASEISSKGYTKKVYNSTTKFTLEKAWTNLGKTNDTLTFYAVWTPNKLTVNYNANGGTLSSDTYKLSNNVIYNKSDGSKYAQSWTYNSAKTNGLVNASTFGLTREGYTFKGWGTTTSGGTIFDQNDSTLVPTSINSAIKNGSCSTTLYAIWTPKTYSVKFDANAGSGAPSAQTKTYGKSLTLSSAKPIREGYEFLGWATSKTASSAVYQPGSSYSANSAVTLYAVWKETTPIVSHIHEWNEAYTVDKEPTCTEDGSKSIHCKTCNETKSITVIPATGHSYKEVVIKEATCSEKGIKATVCSKCGAEKDRTEIPMTDHHFISTVITQPTCSTEGLQEDVCSECSVHANSKTIPMIEHEFGDWTVEKDATSESDGTEIRKCKSCNYTETRNIDYIPVYDEDAPRISMTSANAKAGEEIEVQIKLENNPGITALRLVVYYDEDALEMTGFEFGDALSSMNKGTSENYGNDYSFSMYSATADLTDCGTLAIIKFKVKEDAADGEYPITIAYDPDDIFNLAGDCVDFDIEIGAVIVNSCLLGDVNNDGKINMRDVVLLQQVVNGWNVTYNKDAADYNGDGKTNMRDIVALQQYING